MASPDKTPTYEEMNAEQRAAWQVGYRKGYAEAREPHRAARDELKAMRGDVDALFGWLQRNYPKALDEMPTSLYQGLRFGG